MRRRIARAVPSTHHLDMHEAEPPQLPSNPLQGPDCVGLPSDTRRPASRPPGHGPALQDGRMDTTTIDRSSLDPVNVASTVGQMKRQSSNDKAAAMGSSGQPPTGRDEVRISEARLKAETDVRLAKIAAWRDVAVAVIDGGTRFLTCLPWKTFACLAAPWALYLLPHGDMASWVRVVVALKLA